MDTHHNMQIQKNPASFAHSFEIHFLHKSAEIAFSYPIQWNLPSPQNAPKIKLTKSVLSCIYLLKCTWPPEIYVFPKTPDFHPVMYEGWDTHQIGVINIVHKNIGRGTPWLPNVDQYLGYLMKPLWPNMGINYWWPNMPWTCTLVSILPSFETMMSKLIKKIF